MSDFKGCLGWLAATIGWFLLWGFCMYIGDAYKISPFVVLLIMLVGSLVVVGLGFYFCLSVHDRVYDKHKNRVQYIKKKYYLAYCKYVDSNRIKKDYSGNITALSELKKISSREDYVWEYEERQLRDEKRKQEQEWEENADRIKKQYPDGYSKWEATRRKNFYIISDFVISDEENEIRILDQQLKISNWENEQMIYANRCRELRDELLNTYGCYLYNIDLRLIGGKGPDNFSVWQMFPFSYCLEEDLDYTHFPLIKANGHLVKKRWSTLQKEQACAIASFVNKLNQEEKTSVYFCPIKCDRDPWTDIPLYDHIILGLDDSVDYLIRTDFFSDKISEVDKWTKGVKRRVVIIDIVTDNERLVTMCNDVVNMLEKKRPLLTFISIQKGLDREEMEKLIDNNNKKNAEQAQKKLEEENAKKNLLQSVSSWDTFDIDLHYSYLFYYYPTTCDFEATDEEWFNRKIVWDFKNTPGKTLVSDHQEALDKVIPMLKEKLLTTFGAESLKYLTLVCIPASSQVKTQARYEDFSNRICTELGMANAYSHIIVKTAKMEKHLGGTIIDTSMLSFDDDYFKGRYVLLFDDVITKGESMRTFRCKMKSLGAIVVGGLALGKTKHVRPT
ncbi:MAG: phosphoribosyltransferase [Paludibacteraceae bacterium]|nr:phosphoribosyltransferase [Paludibacteraceae bacterium]